MILVLNEPNFNSVLIGCSVQYGIKVAKPYLNKSTWSIEFDWVLLYEIYVYLTYFYGEKNINVGLITNKRGILLYCCKFWVYYGGEYLLF